MCDNFVLNIIFQIKLSDVSDAISQGMKPINWNGMNTIFYV